MAIGAIGEGTGEQTTYKVQFSTPSEAKNLPEGHVVMGPPHPAFPYFGWQSSVEKAAQLIINKSDPTVFRSQAELVVYANDRYGLLGTGFESVSLAVGAPNRPPVSVTDIYEGH